jgi:hypothetical protein
LRTVTHFLLRGEYDVTKIDSSKYRRGKTTRVYYCSVTSLPNLGLKDYLDNLGK